MNISVLLKNVGLMVLFTLFATSSAYAQSGSVSWNNPGIANPPPNIQHFSFFSSSMQTQVGYTVYLPPSYSNSTQPYPVIYFLHGMQGNEWNYHNSANNVNSLPNLIQSGAIPETIVIFANGGKGLNYVDSAGSCVTTKECPETMIITELIPEVDARFRTISSQEGRAIQGFSMGGIGASYYGTKYPHLFSSVASLSSACYLMDSCTQVQNWINENTIAAGNNKPAFKLSYGNETNAIKNWQNDLLNLMVNQGYTIGSITVLFEVGHDLGAQLSTSIGGMTFGRSLGLFHWDHFGTNPNPNPTPSPTGTPTPAPTGTPTPTGIPSPTPVPSPSNEPSPTMTPRPTRSPRPSPQPRVREAGLELTATELSAADLDGNGRVDKADFAQLSMYFGTEHCAVNIVDTCLIDIHDYNALYEAYLAGN